MQSQFQQVFRNYKWCCGIDVEMKVLVSHFKCIDEQIIYGKTNNESNDFDILLFARRDMKHITIPDNIKIIGSCCFNSCKSLEQIEISPNSKLPFVKDLFLIVV